MTNEKSDPKSQLERFKETARAVDTDNSEEAFNNVLKRIAKEPVVDPKAAKRK